MPLSDDQRAMLQLVLQHGQTYEDISALQGLEVEQVRTSARAALTEIGGEDPDRQVGLTDYLLGQADPIGRADVARQLQADAGTRALAERLEAQLRLIAPGADLPDLQGNGPAPAKRKPAPAAKPAPKPAPGGGPDVDAPATSAGGRFGDALSGKRSQVIAGAAGAAVLIVVVVLAIAGVFGGGDDSSSSKGSGGNGGNSQTASDQGPPRANLEAQDGSDAKGVAVLGQIRRVPTLQVTAFNLDPTSNGDSYAIWLRSSQTAIPLGRTKVSKSGRMQVRLPLPSQLLQFIGDRTLTSVDVSLVTDSDFKKTVSRARSRKKLPQFTGKSILSGQIIGSGLSSSSSGSNSSG